MANAPGLPDPVMKQACVLFKPAQDNDLLPGRSIEGFTTAALYAAARLNKTPRPIGDFAPVSKVDHNRVTDSYSVLNRKLALPVPPSRPIEYLPQLVSTVDVPPSVEQKAADLLKALAAEAVCQGRKPAGVAAAALYHTAKADPRIHVTQTDLAAVADVATATIRTNVDTIMDYLNDT